MRARSWFHGPCVKTICAFLINFISLAYFPTSLLGGNTIEQPTACRWIIRSSTCHNHSFRLPLNLLSNGIKPTSAGQLEYLLDVLIRTECVTMS
ncbi:hypothetical protein EDD22DRAFT_906618 [Suillus occidentalis]|nr:hypothetical protein EDD22DRAFT_906618 [Suillus occidentalis]